MEGGDGPAAISINPSTIKAAQEEMGRLDVLVCGQCHSVFHFIEEFQDHRSKEGACSKTSHFRENSNNEQKAQVWAFLLWKDTQIQQDHDKDTANSWKLYQKWCKMDTHTRDCWITAGKTIQTFTKINNTKMQEVPRQQGNITTEGSRTVFVRKVIRNGQPETPDKKEFKADIKIKTEPVEVKEKLKLKPSVKPKGKSNESADIAGNSDEEFAVEKILAKRFNPKKKVYEYLLKWEGYAHEHNTWEEVAHVSATCKQLMDEFEKNLAKQKEIKAQQVAKSINRANQLGMGMGQKLVKVDNVKAGPSTATQAGRPMRSSKSKAMDQVKQWCGSMKEEENDVLGKRKIPFSDSDSEDDALGGINSIKRSKLDTSGDDDWTNDSEEDKVIIGQSDVIQRAFSRANAQSNGSNRSSTPLTGTDIANSMLANTKGVKIDSKQSNIQQQSNVYIVHRKDGIIKLDSSPTNKITVKGPNQTSSSGVLMMPNRDGSGNIVRKQIVSSSHANSITPVKVISKADGTQVVTQMKVVPKTSPTKSGTVIAPKNEPIKIQPKPDPNQLQQIHLVTAVPGPLSIQPQRMTTTVRPGQRSTDGRPLLPRPAGMRTSTPTTTGLMTITQTRTPVRAPPPRQITPQGVQQRQIMQKRTTPTSTIVQVSSPGVLTTVRPKITVMNQQGKVVQKTVVSPSQVMRTTGKMTTVNKNQSVVTPQQKMMMARRKVAEQAGVVTKTVARGGATGATRGTAGRGRGGRMGDTASNANKPKESKLAETDGLHMEFHQIESEESSSEGEPDFPPMPTEPAQPTEPDSPPRQFTLCPLTGRIIGPDGEPLDQPDPEPEPTPPAPTPMAIVQVPTSGTATIGADGLITTTSNETAELVLPTLESLTDGSGGIVRVEMSPGGTTGTIVQSNEPESITLSSVVGPGPDLPCLDDPEIEVQSNIPTSTGNVVVTVPSVTSATVTETPTTIDALATTVISSEPPVPVTTTTVTTTAEGTTTVSVDTVPTSEESILPTVTNEEEATSTVDAITAATTAANVKMEEGNLVTITGEDGVVYQVTGETEDGQTLLVTHGPDGEQQCVYVATTGEQGDGSVLTLDHAVAEAVAQLMPDQVNLAPQFYVKEGDGTTEGAEGSAGENQQMVMSIMDNTNTVGDNTQEDGETQAQVVAQVVQADEPYTPGGMRKLVLLMPDGKFLMTDVDEEQYVALDLDK